MKRLLLLRHAKSSWSKPGLEDFDRPLASRGRTAAPRMGREMARRGLVPELTLCSGAARARQTWDLAAETIDAAPEVRVLRSLYMAEPSRLLAQVRRAPAEAPCILLIGHNPGLETVAARLAGPQSKRRAVKRLRAKYPTAALACFELDIDDWADLAEGGARLTAFIRPKDLD